MTGMDKIKSIDWHKFSWAPCFEAINEVVRCALPRKQEVSSYTSGNSTTETISDVGDWPEDATIREVLASPSRTQATYTSGYGMTTVSHYAQAYDDCHWHLCRGIEELIGDFDESDVDVYDFLHSQVVEVMDEAGAEGAYVFSGYNKEEAVEC